MASETLANEYFDLADFVPYTNVAWALGFECSTRRVKKVYLRLVLLIFNLPNFSEATTEHNEYDDDLDVKDGEIPIKVMPRFQWRLRM